MLSPLRVLALLPREKNVAVMRPHGNSSRCPSVSIIIPCYNYGRYLPECVESVLDQEGVRVDVLIIDDASPDGSAGIASGLAARDPRIHAICHAANQGHVATYNEGVAHAAGDYTVLLSADDLLTPGCLARATSLMEECPSVGLTYGFPLEFTGPGLPPARTVTTSWIVWKGHDWIGQVCKTARNLLLSPEAVMRTSVLREIGGYRDDLPLTCDLEMWMRAATVSDVGYVAGADQAYYRNHSVSMHNSFDRLGDFYARLRAFDTVFTERPARLADAPLMAAIAHRALAREMLAHTISAYARGAAHREPIDEYVVFALNVWPGARQLSEWRALCRLRKMRGSKLRRDTSLMIRGATLRMRYSLRWQRWRLVGV
jgi:glycosyltransferase involved in cell wall biosynthesis